MPTEPQSPYLVSLCNKIDLVRVPFSDRGSRLLLYRDADHDAFYIKLAERLEKLQPGLETHRSRPAFISDIQLLDESGRPLTFELETYPHVIHCQTRIGRFSLVYYNHDTLAVGLPADTGAGVTMVVSDLFRPSQEGASDPIYTRRVVLGSSNKPIVHTHEPVEIGERMTMIAKAGDWAAIHISLPRGDSSPDTVPPFPETYAKATERWNSWFAKVPQVRADLEAPYAYAWWVLANNLVSPMGHVPYEAMMPSKAQYFGIWNWDAAFHAIGLRHADPGLARDQVRTILSRQLADGMLPDVVHDGGVVDHLDHPIRARVTKPPVMAWAVLKIHEVDPDLEFLREIYPGLKRWNRWWFEGGVQGLAQYHHPYSSGLDDSPLWEHGFPVVAPDLNTYLVIQMESLAAIAGQLDLTDEARAWRVQSEQLAERMLEVLYDPAQGFFWPQHAGEPIMERTPFSLYPLWTGSMPAAIEAQLVGQLTDPDLFWGAHPLSTVARNAASYAPTTMWRGPVWININYLFVEALERVGRKELAGELRRRTIDLVASNPGIYEFYNPEDGTAPPRAAPIFGWSAALFIDLCLQEMSTGSST